MEREEEIRDLAYRIWEEEGYPEGRNLEHWVKAEAILKARNGQPANGPAEQTPAEVQRPARKRVTRSRIARATS